VYRLPQGPFRIIALAFALLVLAVSAATATTLDPVAVECPVCEHSFNAQEVRSSNTFGGLDPDLCRHARGYQPLSYHLWTCPSCSYTREGKAFAQPVSADLAKWVRSELRSPAPIADDAEQADIPGWVKAELAIEVVLHGGADKSSLGPLYRMGMFLERVECSDLKSPLWEDEALRSVNDAVHERFLAAQHVLPRDRAGTRTVTGREVVAATSLLAAVADSEGVERDVAELYGALVLRVHGEFGPSEPILLRLAENEAAAEAIRAVSRAMLASIEREKSFLRRFAEWLEPGLDPQRDLAPEEVRLAFLMGEARRRLGNDADAAKWLRRALESPGLAVSERVLAHEAAAFPHSAGTQYAAVDAEEWPDSLAALVASLEEEESAGDAEESLSLLADQGALDALVASLDHEDPIVRTRVVFALRGYARPGDGALSALRRHVLDPEEEDEVRWEGIETLVRFGRTEDAELYRRLLADPDWFLAEVPVQGLAVVGDGSDVPRILALRGDIPEIAARAFSLLTNRDATDAEAFDDWWKDHAAESRESWVADGFGDELADPEVLTSRANVPALIEFLQDDRTWIRVNAQRTLHAISGKDLALRLALDEGRSPMGELSEPPPLRDVVGGGTVLYYRGRPAFDLNDMDPAFARVFQRPYAESSWRRAAAIWRHWWDGQGRK